MNRITKTKAIGISKTILLFLLLGGALYVAASSPYFALNLSRNISKIKKQNKRKINSAFQYLKSRGLIEVRKEGHDLCIALTKKGKKRAGQYQINDLAIDFPKRWDGKWRVIIFDIPDLQRAERNAFRNKLKELGFYSLQKSVWLHAFDCKKEVELLRNFFGIGKKEIRLMVVEELEEDEKIKKVFGV